MALIDPQGRLLGKISILDLGAALVILLVVVGIFFFPGTSGSVAQIGVATKPVEVDVMVKGLGVSNPQSLVKPGEKTNLIIRNQPYGQINVKSVEILPRTTPVPQPDGSVKALPDPRPELKFSADLLLTLSGEAKITSKGPVLGNSNIKVGTLVELEGLTYDFNASVIDVRIQP
ncbi:hypothetical protein DO97_02925 [Neosynechococcus sphagnicola sy1]|uniref:Pyruvate/2-oxoglutarate dehydrogenase complex,dihydrolipoamide dehydrogenase (E3) component n=1 Tax=Neosynechococcus sphagnicola sy1 TaxID=1497020 RepID=A0A098TQA9_9CYAN|nr:DUF4330 domain-containing protein [Neosynechococcus sphagnicola]KGF73013.1 hypothetical protein DO97_02925 [Neosynechococcus sphagnicola sy1]